ncbi:MAG: ArsR family transcriptional regulator, partial [Calditrichaeota bacterium]|nr:ArsR family transcriptional regulator [Calditrichota bacterium]
MRELTKIFKALSDSNRLRILKMLEIRALCVCEITEV